LYVAKGAKLDLAGRTLKVAEVGGEGTIVNGTLVVDEAICPGDVGRVGSLTCEAQLEVSGASLVIEGDGTGACDKLVLDQAFSCAGLRLAVRDYTRLTAPVSCMLASAGGVTGPFAADNIPNRKTWCVRFTSTAAELVRTNGLVFILK
jgi:phosphatidylserine decarboxylase